MSTQQKSAGILGRAEYKGGNILSYPFIAVGIFLLANAAVVSGLLLIGGGLIIMPRVKRHFLNIPSIVGWGLVIAGISALPA